MPFLAALAFVVATPLATPAATLTGVHWAEPADYQALKKAGVDFVVTTVAPDRPASWAATLDAAQAARIKLIIGAFPSPYVLSADGSWAITPDGIRFLAYLRVHAQSVMAVLAFNEPYWKHPLTHQANPCGAVTAAQLRSLRATIRRVWPEAKIYDDIGSPAAWAPGGSIWRPCMDGKYSDQTGVADYVGIWKYPFTASGFSEAISLAEVRAEARFVTNAMGATPILLGQAFAGSPGNFVFPTAAEIRKWNCDLRTISAGGISWYVWRQNIYSDYLSNHADDLRVMTASAC